jgi:hypothetical protein
MNRLASWVAIGCLLIASDLAAICLAHELTIHVVSSRAQLPDDETYAFDTLERAVSALADIAKQSPRTDVRIQLDTGFHHIERALTIKREEVPVHGSLTFVGGDRKQAVISGGKRITGWTVENDGTWSTIVPEAANRSWSFRELFVGGQRRPRARHPNKEYLRIERAFDDKRTGFIFNAGDLPKSWTTGGELVFLHDWSTSRIPIKSVNHTTRQLSVAFPIGNRADHYRIDNFEPHPRYFVENRPEFFDAPGEWLLEEQGKLRYRPLPGETPDTAPVIAPVANQLVIVNGDADGPVRNVHFEGLDFQHCAWPLPDEGYAGSQATAHEQRGEDVQQSSRGFIPAAIQVEHAEDCSFRNCRIAHVGTSGIAFGSRTKRCRLEDSIVEDISGNGVNIGEDGSRAAGGRPWWQAVPEQAAAGNVVKHNRIEHCGQQFFGAVAVWVGLACDTKIANNEIANHPYTGVSIGWMWNPTPTPAAGNIVSQNHIHHVMQELSDGGGIYTLGRQPGTRLVENVIHDVSLNVGRAESNGMFLDEGSDQIEIVDNVIYGTDRSPLRFHRAEHLTVRGNTLVVPTADTPPLRYNNTDPETIVQLGNRVVPQSDFDATKIKAPPAGLIHDADRP